MSFLHKLRNLPERTKKIILWITVAIIGLSLLFLWANNFQQRIKNFKTEEFKQKIQFPSLQEELKGFPKINIPKIELPQFYEE